MAENVNNGGRFDQQIQYEPFAHAGGAPGSKPPPSCWNYCAPSTEHRFKAVFTCPQGHTFPLSGHKINHKGRCYPSVVCPEPGCTFHSWVELVGWAHGALLE